MLETQVRFRRLIIKLTYVRSMEIIEQLPEYMVVSNQGKSALYQPKRISLSSKDDVNPEGNNIKFTSYSLAPLYYNNFKIVLQRPVIQAKSIQLLRASMPTANTNIPDTECVFWYYRTLETDLIAKNNSNNLSVGNLGELCYIRLCPSFYPPYFIGTQYGYNRTFASYNDIVTELNRAAAADPGNNPNTASPRYFPDDVIFAYDARQNKITFQGTSALHYYQPVAYQDPNLSNAAMLANFAQVTIPTAALYQNPFYSQPLSKVRNLNLRLGWTYTNYNLNITTANQCIGGLAGAINYANSYCDLVYSSDVYIYLDFILGNTLDSAGNGNLLSVVPLSTSNLGVAFYINQMTNPITQIPDTISEIQVRLFTDSGEPFYLPNSAIMNLEIAFAY